MNAPRHPQSVRRILLSAAAAMLVVAVSSCHQLAAGYSRLGVQSAGSSLLVRYLPCPGEVISRVSIYQLDDDNVAMESGDVLLWEATSGSDLRSLVADGVVPSIDDRGLELDPGVDYWVDVETSMNTIDSDAFTADDLHAHTVRVNGENLRENDFVKRARATCD
jgi:hypothetical protein